MAELVENSNIRVDCYLAVLKKFKKLYPNERFEVITLTSKSPLAPSKKLLERAKESNMAFQDYCIQLGWEYAANHQACEKLKELANYSLDKILFLVCYEKDSSICHRSYVKKVLEIYQQKYLKPKPEKQAHFNTLISEVNLVKPSKDNQDKTKLVFKWCKCGVFNESTLSTYCLKLKKTCDNWEKCKVREPREKGKTNE